MVDSAADEESGSGDDSAEPESALSASEEEEASESAEDEEEEEEAAAAEAEEGPAAQAQQQHSERQKANAMAQSSGHEHTAPGPVAEDTDDIPFTFAAPAGYAEFAKLAAQQSPVKLGLIVERIRACNAISLATDNRRKLQASLLWYASHLLFSSSHQQP